MNTETQRVDVAPSDSAIPVWKYHDLERENTQLRIAQASQAAELAALKAKLASYEANGVTCQTFGHVVGACAECNTHEDSPEALKADIARQATEIEALRRLLCAVYAGFSSYTDDGEASDASRFPFIDFLRDSVDQIEAKMRERAFARVAAMQTEEAS